MLSPQAPPLKHRQSTKAQKIEANSRTGSPPPRRLLLAATGLRDACLDVTQYATEITSKHVAIQTGRPLCRHILNSLPSNIRLRVLKFRESFEVVSEICYFISD